MYCTIMEKQYLEELSKTITKVLYDNDELKPLLESFEEAGKKARAEKQ